MRPVKRQKLFPLTLTGWVVVLSAPALLACLAGLFLR